MINRKTNRSKEGITHVKIQRDIRQMDDGNYVC